MAWSSSRHTITYGYAEKTVEIRRMHKHKSGEFLSFSYWGGVTPSVPLIPSVGILVSLLLLYTVCVQSPLGDKCQGCPLAGFWS